MGRVDYSGEESGGGRAAVEGCRAGVDEGTKATILQTHISVGLKCRVHAIRVHSVEQPSPRKRKNTAVAIVYPPSRLCPQMHLGGQHKARVGARWRRSQGSTQ